MGQRKGFLSGSGVLSRYAENDRGISDGELVDAVKESIVPLLPGLKKVLLLPPDFTRFHSKAGRIVQILCELLESLCAWDIMPALGTHEPMSQAECAEFFGADIPYDKLIKHDWRNDVVRLGEVPAAFVSEVSGGLMNEAVTVEVNRRIIDPSYDLVISIGQVVPHEVVGMANHNKNIFVGCGGSSMINSSHMIGAFYGMERMMGRDKTPVRKILDYAQEHFLHEVPLLFIQTVTTAVERDITLHGLFIGSGRETFEKAVALSQLKNITMLERPLKKVVVFLDEQEFKSTWLGNKSIYRTRMAIGQGGALVVLAPGVAKFGEDPENDRLIRKYGYVGRLRVLELFRQNKDMQENQSVPAHLIHGSSDGKFSITYATRKLTRDEVEGVNFQYAAYEEMIKRYNPKELREGFNTMPDGEEIFFIGNPALGLWVNRETFEGE